MFRTATVGAMLLVSAGVVSVQGAGDKEPGDIDVKVVEAWKKAGAQVGWMYPEAISPVFSPDRPKAVSAVGAFRPENEALPKLKDLPAPAVPFGLDLSSLPVTDADLKAVARFSKLRMLDLFDTKISDAGLKELAGLVELHHLYLDLTMVGDDGVKALAGLKQLRTLVLYNTKITDACLKEVGGLKELRVLDLSDTKITDAGLKELTGLTRLETLLLDGTRVTEPAVEALRKALPKCKIEAKK
jgi:hypothetical protein